MALTKEVLAANAALASLTAEQVEAIVNLSANDESAVIGARIGQIYRDLDTTIAASTGVSRNGDEKTYKYLERAAKELAEKAGSVDAYKKQVTELTVEKKRLEKAIADGEGAAEAAKQLAQAQKDLTAVRKQFADLKASADEAARKHAAELFDVRIDNEMRMASAGIKFKAELPQSATSVLLDQALRKIKGYAPEYIDNGNGGKALAFKDESGAIMRNPENQLNPYTAAELVKKELKAMGVLDEGVKVKGAGTQPPTTTGSTTGIVVDVQAARTRVEAYDAIANSLMAQGLTNGSAEFDAAMQQAWKDNNVANLPEK